MAGRSMSQNAMKLSLWFFSPRKQIYGVGVEVGGRPGGARRRGTRPRGGTPHPRGQGVGPLALVLSPVFFINSEKLLCGYQVIPRTFISA